MTNIGNLSVKLAADVEQFQNQLNTASQSVSGFAGRMQSVVAGIKGGIAGLAAAFAMREVAQFSTQIIDTADNIEKLSQKIGVSVGDLAKWKVAADLSDVDLETFGNGIKKLSKYIVEDGENLRELGIDTTDANTAMIGLADVIASMPDGIEKTTFAAAILGQKIGPELIPLLNGGSEGLRKMYEQGGKYAERMAELAPLAESYNDQLTIMRTELETAMIPVLTAIATKLGETAKMFNIARASGLGFYQSMNMIAVTGRRKSEESDEDFVARMPSIINDINSEIKFKQQEIEAIRRREKRGDLHFWEYDDAGKLQNEIIDLQKEQNAAAKMYTLSIPDGMSYASDHKPINTKVRDSIIRKSKDNPAKTQKVVVEKDPNAAANDYLKTLQDQIDLIDGRNTLEEAALRIQTVQLTTASDQVKTQILLSAKKLDEEKINASLLKSYESINAIADDYATAIDDAIKAQTESTAQSKEELEIRKIDLQVEKDIAALRRENRNSDEAEEAIRSAAEAAKQKIHTATAVDKENSQSSIMGIKKAWKEISEQIEDYNTQAAEFTKRTFDQMGDALADYVLTGKSSFKDLAKSIIDDLSRMIIKQTMFNAVKAAGTYAGFFADGGVFSGGNVVPFASGGVVASPTNFPMSGGRVGLMGEAGPEAIMPLKRINGKLGVVAQGGGSVINAPVYNITQNIQGNENPKVTADAATRNLMAAVAKQEITNAKRPGGLLNKMAV